MLPQELLGASYSRDDVYDAAADIYTGVGSIYLAAVHSGRVPYATRRLANQSGDSSCSGPC